MSGAKQHSEASGPERVAPPERILRREPGSIGFEWPKSRTAWSDPDMAPLMARLVKLEGILHQFVKRLNSETALDLALAAQREVLIHAKMPELEEPCDPLDELCKANYENESDDAWLAQISGIIADSSSEE